MLAVTIAVPLGLLGARNCAPHPVVYVLARRVMDVLRAVNEFVFALMFVTAVGLGPFAGTLALGIHTGVESRSTGRCIDVARTAYVPTSAADAVPLSLGPANVALS